MTTKSLPYKTRIVGLTIPPYPECFYLSTTEQSYSSSHTVMSESKSSVKSEGGAFYKKVPRFRAKPLKPLVAPRLPVLRLTPLPRPPDLSRVPVRYRRSVMDRFNRLYSSISAKRRSQLQRYHTAYAAYVIRLKRYQHAVAKRLASAQVVVWDRQNVYNLPENPYYRQRVVENPVYGRSYQSGSYAPVSCRYWPFRPFNTGSKISSTEWTGYIAPAVLQAPLYSAPSGSGFDEAIVSAEGRARSNLYQRLSGQKVHLGNMVAERVQTIEMIVNMLHALRHPTDAFVSLVKNLRSNPLSTMGDAYLQFKFGIQPLMNDLYNMQSALQASQNIPDIVIVHGSSSSSAQFSWRDKTVMSGGVPLYWYDVQATRSVRVHYKLVYRVNSGTLAGMSSLGLINPLEIAWEVTPWSFVIDWFLPVGTFIQSLQAGTGLTYQYGSRTQVTKDHFTATLSGVTADVNSLRAFSGTGSKSVETKQRTVLTQPPAVQLPSFKNPMTATHLAEAFALLSQRFK